MVSKTPQRRDSDAFIQYLLDNPGACDDIQQAIFDTLEQIKSIKDLKENVIPDIYEKLRAQGVDIEEIKKFIHLFKDIPGTIKSLSESVKANTAEVSTILVALKRYKEKEKTLNKYWTRAKNTFALIGVAAVLALIVAFLSGSEKAFELFKIVLD